MGIQSKGQYVISLSAKEKKAIKSCRVVRVNQRGQILVLYMKWKMEVISLTFIEYEENNPLEIFYFLYMRENLQRYVHRNL